MNGDPDHDSFLFPIAPYGMGDPAFDQEGFVLGSDRLFLIQKRLGQNIQLVCRPRPQSSNDRVHNNR